MGAKVSILITCYNLEDSINNSISSVVSQELPFEWELLIGDDGSNDKSIEIIQKWIYQYPKNIKLYTMSRDKDENINGTRAARNRANLLRKASGEYLIFLDGDDYFLGTEKLKNQVEILENKEYSHCSGVAHNIIAYDVEKNTKKYLADVKLRDGVIDTKKYIRELYFHTNTILFRKKCLDMMLNPLYCDYLNDNFITFIILQYGELYYLHNAWAQYNLTGQGLWTGKKRTYGCFRNIILYDLERHINPSLSKEIFLRNISNFRFIFHNYTLGDKALIFPLVKELSDPPFHKTILLYKLNSNLNTKEKKELLMLKLKVFLNTNIIRFKRFPIYIKKVLRRY